MDLTGKKILVIGGAGLIGSHIVEELLKDPVKEVIVYDNLTRGTTENLASNLTMPSLWHASSRPSIPTR